MRHFWLDRITQLEPGVRATGVKAVALAEEEFDVHFPGNPVLPGVYLLEGLAQTAGVLLERSDAAHRLALLATVERARFVGFARPGDLVTLEAEIESFEGAYARVRATASVQGRPIATARLTFKLVATDRLIPAVYQPFWRQTIETWLGRYPELDDG
jgi:3-hydroxyacyl-[acyl-carrier-protein] dehydratase